MNRPPSAIAHAAGRVLVVGYPAGGVPDVFAEWAEHGALGGIILFKRNLPDLRGAAEATAAYLSVHGPATHPLVAVDQEGGRVARLGPPVVKLPPARELSMRPETEIHEVAELLGRQLRALGFNWDMAPVLDIDTNPANPIIGDRAFGATADAVIQRALPFAAGLGAAGVLACGKHFPGHGDTDLDSHLALPRLPHDLERLRKVELAPFAAARSQVPSIMTAHVVFEALDPGVPATLSRRVITDLLRVDLGYDGVIVSDDLEMKAIADHYGVEEAATRAIQAGCDVLLVCSEVDRAIAARRALIAEAERSTEFRDRLLDAARRVDRMAASVPRLLAPDPETVEAEVERLSSMAPNASGITAT